MRAQVLRTALALDPINQVTVIKNSHIGLLRYGEVLIKLVAVRLKQRPDIYLLTFRGYEILLATNLLTWPKPLIFDEMINPLEWLQEPRPEAWAKLIPKSSLRGLYRLLLSRSRMILADTAPHARYSAELTYGQPDKRYKTLPVGTNETVFYPSSAVRPKNKRFRVFYYGNMLPLHGLQYVIEAANSLKELPIDFCIVGGSVAAKESVQAAKRVGAQISYQSWVDFKQLPIEIKKSDLCLGGPFGNTIQASYVVTGKTYQFIACGIPTLIGKNKASWEFTDKMDCLMVPLGSGQALADAIRWAYKHPKELAQIGKNGRKLYDKLFSNKVISDELKNLLSQF